MTIGKTLHLIRRQDWRRWLRANHKSAREIWLIYPRKVTGKPRISYGDAVEEALCFGWIDSTVKPLDANHTAHRFSPRRPGSKYSQANLERLRSLVARRRVIPAVANHVRDLLREEFVPPADILRAIQANDRAWRNFQSFSKSYQRIRIAYINAARHRPEEFRKRLRNFIAMTEKNKMFGYGGIEKYY